ncbi:MAG: DUF6265 family protein [Burkholderiales bacterium]|jgi:hypothetical protein|nr:DUF6265 family protein [Burkholderiales bacterium]
MKKPFSFFKTASLLLPALLLGACAQTPLKSEPQTPATAEVAPATVEAQQTESKQEHSGPLAPLAWLEGCWRGNVNQREFREHWLPLRGDMILGISHTVLGDKTQDYQFLRMELRDDAVHYVIAAHDEKEHRFRLSGETTDQEDTIYTFTNLEDVFPQTVSYRKASGGWMYITVEGKLNGADRKVIYPIRRIGCESGEFLIK